MSRAALSCFDGPARKSIVFAALVVAADGGGGCGEWQKQR